MARHTALDVAPTKGENVDGAQGVHAVPPSPLAHVPAGHVAHWAVPGLGAMDPGAHGTQRFDVAFAKRPTPQGEHAAVGAPAFVDTQPAAHVHAAEPVDTESVKAPHAKHDVDCEEGAKKPTAHAAHVAVPTLLSVYEPGAHGMHAVSSEEP